VKPSELVLGREKGILPWARWQTREGVDGRSLRGKLRRASVKLYGQR
jgi:hypothetical protein